MTGASSAVKSHRETIMAPRSAKRLRAMTRQAPMTLCKYELTLSAALHALGKVCCFIFASLFQLDARVEPLVTDIDDQIDKYVSDGDQQYAALHDGIVARVNPFDHQ